jgi:hypothetical protein
MRARISESIEVNRREEKRRDVWWSRIDSYHIDASANITSAGKATARMLYCDTWHGQGKKKGG